MKTHAKRHISPPLISSTGTNGINPVGIGMRKMVTLFILFLMLAFLPLNAISEQNAPHDDGLGLDIGPGDGNYTTDGLWEIESGDRIEHTGITILITDRMVINGGGVLNLTNVVLLMGKNTANKPMIDVHALGELNLVNCTVAPSEGSYAYALGYAFRFNTGSRGSLINCSISDVNTTIGLNNEGLVVESSSVEISDCTFNSSFTGITSSNSSPSITNCTFHDNDIGLAVKNTPFFPRMSVTGCTFRNNTVGIYVTGISILMFDNNDIINNAEGIRCENIDFQGRYPTFSDCTVTGNSEYGFNLSNSRCYITDSTITHSPVGLMAWNCVNPTNPIINGSSVGDCDVGILADGSTVTAVGLTAERCSVSLSARNDSIFYLNDLIIPGGPDSDVGISMNSSITSIEDSTIGPVTETFSSEDSVLTAKNTSIATPYDLFLNVTTSNFTFLNTNTFTDRVVVDDISYVIEGGFHDIHTARKNGTNASWVTVKINGTGHNKEILTNYYGRTEEPILLHHRRLENQGPNTSYGIYIFTAVYLDYENSHVIDVTDGLDVELTVNAPPEADDVELLPSSPLTEDNLTTYWTFYDRDAEDLQVNMSLKWYRDDVLVPQFENITTINSSYTMKNERWFFTLKVSDGGFWSDLYTSAAVTIGNTPPRIDDISDIDIFQGENIIIPFEVYDPDNDSLEIVLETDAIGAVLAGNESAVIYKPPISESGLFSFNVRVFDGIQRVDAAFNVTVLGIISTGGVNFVISNETGPVGGVNVSVWDPVNYTVLKFKTNESGVVEISGRMEGINSFTVWKEGFWATDHEIVIERGKTITKEILLQPMPTTDFRFEVTDTSGNRISLVGVSLQLLSFDVTGLTIPPEANVTLWLEEYQRNGDYVTDTAGAIEIPDLYVGEYLVIVEKELYETYRGILTVTESNETEMGLLLYGEYEKKMGFIEGTVRSPSGKLLKGVEIEFEDRYKKSYNKTTDGSGYYKIELSKGTYTIRIIHKGYKLYLDEITIPNENPVMDINLERREEEKEDDKKFEIRISIILTVCIVILLWTLFFYILHKPKKLKTVDEIIAEEEDKILMEKEKKDNEYRKKIYQIFSGEKPLEDLAELGEKIEKERKMKKEMAILDEIVKKEKGRYRDKGTDFVRSGYGAVFKEYMSGNEIEFDDDVAWGGTDEVPDVDELDIEEDILDDVGADEGYGKKDAFGWADDGD